MPESYWGMWSVSSADELFKVEDISIIECIANEPLQDENGVAAESSLYYDPCMRLLIMGQSQEGVVIWSRYIGNPSHKRKKLGTGI